MGQDPVAVAGSLVAKHPGDLVVPWDGRGEEPGHLRGPQAGERQPMADCTVQQLLEVAEGVLQGETGSSILIDCDTGSAQGINCGLEGRQHLGVSGAVRIVKPGTDAIVDQRGALCRRKFESPSDRAGLVGTS